MASLLGYINKRYCTTTLKETYLASFGTQWTLF